ncbi:MAG TPA: hypothetical protein VI893_08430 [Thermoplasmata archaeon]|nr:hypothetical protein [Thermoplasmata archaeon]
MSPPPDARPEYDSSESRAYEGLLAMAKANALRSLVMVGLIAFIYTAGVYALVLRGFSNWLVVSAFLLILVMAIAAFTMQIRDLYLLRITPVEVRTGVLVFSCERILLTEVERFEWGKAGDGFSIVLRAGRSRFRFLPAEIIPDPEQFVHVLRHGYALQVVAPGAK